MKHQFDIIRDQLTLSECLFLARRHRAPAGCFFFSGAEEGLLSFPPPNPKREATKVLAAAFGRSTSGASHLPGHA